MRKVLFISYCFPPIYSVDSTMALNAIKYLAKIGWEPLVVSAGHSLELGHDSSAAATVPQDLVVKRTVSTENLFYRLLNWLGAIPDAMFGWKTSALEAVRKLFSQYKIDAIISRSNPITSHLIGLIIKCMRPEIPWVVSFGDPWTQNPYVKYRWPWVRPYREKIERKILQNADAIIVTTELTKQLFVSKYGLANKIHVLPNTYDPAEFVSFIKGTENNHPMQLTYAGNLYGLRSPEPLLAALKILCSQDANIADKLKIQFIGSLGKFSSIFDDCNINNLVNIVEPLPRARTLQLLSQSDGFISIDAGWPIPSIFLPAKLMDYLIIGKPILAITPEGETAGLIRATNAGLVASPSSPNEIASAILQLYQRQVVFMPNILAIEKYSAVVYAQNLAKLLDQLVNETVIS